MIGDTWESFIGKYSVLEILELLEDETSVLEGMTLGQAIEFIVRSVYRDSDVWWTDEGYREFLKVAYPDKEDVIRVIKQEVIDELGLKRRLE